MADDCSNLMKKWRNWLITITLFASLLVTVMLFSRIRPAFYLDDFHVASLNKTIIRSTTTNTTTTTMIYFDLRIKNVNEWVGVYYDYPLNLTFTYLPPNYDTTTNTTFTIGEYTLQGFYQGNGKVKHVRDFVVVQDLFSSVAVDPRKELRETRGSLMVPAKVVAFGVNLEAKVKFKSIENKRSDLKVGGIVEINGNTGDVIQKKTVKLTYGSRSDEWGVSELLIFFHSFVVFMSFVFACIGSCVPGV